MEHIQESAFEDAHAAASGEVRELAPECLVRFIGSLSRYAVDGHYLHIGAGNGVVLVLNEQEDALFRQLTCGACPLRSCWPGVMLSEAVIWRRTGTHSGSINWG